MLAPARTDPRARPGTVLVLFAIVLVVLLGITGLVLDLGMMMASRRQAQNAADSAALAAAMELMRGGTPATARAAALAYVQTYNGLTDAATTVNIPPAPGGPHAGDPHFAEVILTRPFQTVFIQVLGGATQRQVGARAVAGYERVQWGEGPIVLDPYARPGISVSGGGTLLVNGTVVVNSLGAGLNENGGTVDWGVQQYAFDSGNNATIKARYVQIVGGVDVVANFQQYDPADTFTPLLAGPNVAVHPDPLRGLPVPRASNLPTGYPMTRNPAVTVSKGETRTFDPGVYENIQINQGATVYFNPGVYIFSPTKPNQGLTMNGGCTVISVPKGTQAAGVMFYMTGSNYVDATTPANSGQWDAADDAQSALDGPLPAADPVSPRQLAGPGLPAPPDPQFSKVDFATFTCNATNAHVNLGGLKDPSSPFNGLLFFQRRRNTTTASIAGNAGVDVTLDGTIYAKWAQFALSGGGVYNSVFVVGSMAVSGGATVVIRNPGTNYGLTSRVYLVE